MAEKININKTIANIINTVPFLTNFPSNHFSVDYDNEADVLYISLDRPQNATDSDMIDDGIIVRYKNKKVVGITILDASRKRRISSTKNSNFS